MLKSYEIEAIGNVAVKKLQVENKKLGIPLVYSVDNKIYYELADGTVTTRSPFAKKEIKMTKNEENEFTIAHTFIKCDYCDYEDKDSDWADTAKTLEKWEGRICPKCGQPMLTKEQAQTIRAVMSTIEFIQLEGNKTATLEIKPEGDVSIKEEKK